MAKSFFPKLYDLVRAYAHYDPATKSKLEILFLYPGVKAWIAHSIAHTLYLWNVPFLPRMISDCSRFWTGIDIHPGAQLGERVIMDHGMGIVIGETAIVGNDVLIYQGVTLGGTSLERVKRHPTIESHCVIGAGAKILGNIVIGQGSRVGANSVVIKGVPAGSTVVGIPAKIVEHMPVTEGHELEHNKLLDPNAARMQELEARMAALEKALTSSANPIDGFEGQTTK